MTRRRKIALVIACLPAALGGLAWLLVQGTGWLPDHVVYLRFSLSYLFVGLGLLLSLFGWALLALAGRLDAYHARRLAALQAEAASRRRQFLQRLDHELKNPLTALQIEAANLEPAGLPAGVSTEHTITHHRLKEQVLRLHDLVVQLRKLGELETRPIEAEPVDLNGLLRELVAEFQANPAAQDRSISLSVPDLPWPLPPVSGDPDLVYLALRNVLANAVKFTRPGDSIQVRAFEAGHGVTVEIADTGPGIPADEQPHVWEELFRGQAARGAPGSGLGLALVKTILERHGGRTGLRSRPEQGTVVTLHFPAHM